jgi:hypothetical protein
VFNLWTKRNGGNNGAIELGHNTYAEGLISEDGNKHNVFMASGTAKDCIAWKCDPANPGGTTMFVSYTTSASADTMDVMYQDCIAIAGNGGTSISTVAYGIYAHTGGPTSYRSVNVSGGFYTNCAFGFDSESQVPVIQGAVFYNNGVAVANVISSTVIVRGCVFASNGQAFSGNINSLTFTENKIYGNNTSDKFIQGSIGSVTVTDNTFIGNPGMTNPNIGYLVGSGLTGTITVKRNIHVGGNPSFQTPAFLVEAPRANFTLNVDSNFYRSGIWGFNLSVSPEFLNLAAMQGLGYETNSADGYTDAMFTGDKPKGEYFLSVTNALHGKAGSPNLYDSVYRFPYNLFNFNNGLDVTSSKYDVPDNVPAYRNVNTRDLYIYKDAWSYNTILLSDSSKRVANTEFVKQLVSTGGYTLPIASTTVLGGVKDGAGLSIDGSGVASVTATLDDVTDNGATTPNNIAVGGITASGIIQARNLINMASPAGTNRFDFVLVDAGSGLYDLQFYNENNSTTPFYISNSNKIYLTGETYLRGLSAPVTSYNLVTHSVSDSITGQIPISNIANSSLFPHTIDKQYTDVNNSGTTETDLYTKTIDPILTANGNSLHFEAAGVNNDATATVNLQALFAGNGIAGAGALTITATGAWSVKGTIIRTGTTTARAHTIISIDASSNKVYQTTSALTGLDFTGTNILKVTGTAGGAGGGSNDITAQLWVITYEP